MSFLCAFLNPGLWVLHLWDLGLWVLENVPDNIARNDGPWLLTQNPLNEYSLLRAIVSSYP